MSLHQHNGSDSSGRQQAAELRNGPAHAAELSALNRLAEEFPVQQRSQYAHQNGVNGHGIAIFGREEIAALAHQLWIARGCPEGSPEVDWYQAAQELRFRAGAH